MKGKWREEQDVTRITQLEIRAERGEKVEGEVCSVGMRTWT